MCGAQERDVLTDGSGNRCQGSKTARPHLGRACALRLLKAPPLVLLRGEAVKSRPESEARAPLTASVSPVCTLSLLPPSRDSFTASSGAGLSKQGTLILL